MTKRPPRFGLTPREWSFLRRLQPASRIQKFLDGLDYDVKGEGCRSPRRVLRERKVQCMDGALFAAAALRVQGYRPLIVDLEAVQDDDHVIAVFRRRGLRGRGRAVELFRPALPRAGSPHDPQPGPV